MTAKTYQAKQPVSLLLPSGTANQLVATADGTAMTMTQATTAMLAQGTVPRTATKIVAASSASAQMFAAADYVCDGVADEVQINAALAALPASGGTVLLSEGSFTLAAPIVYTAARQTLRGMGMIATTLVVVNAGGAPINTAIVIMGYDYDELTDLTIDGNKGNNAASTSTYGVLAQASAGPLIERVHIVSTMSYGLIVQNTVANGVIRDCLIENTGNIGLVMRAVAGQPLVVSGCTVKSSGANGGFWCDEGPVVLSDCQSLSNTGQGFRVAATGTPVVSLSNCLAQGNTAYGFSIANANVCLTGCRSISNAGGGFVTTGAGTQFVGCTASIASIAGHGFLSDTGATDALYSGCVARDTIAGYGCFHHSSAGRSTYVGCRAINFTYWAFRATAGEMHVRGCYAYGAGGSTAIDLSGGANHVIDRCRIANNGGYGIYGVTPNTQITNNVISGSSQLTNNGYGQIVLGSTAPFIHGNVLRDPPSGNRPSYAINISSSDALIGLNQTSGSGVTAEVNDGGTNTRQAVKILLDYTVTTDLIAGVAIAANTWTDVVPNQTFRVDQATDYIEIAVIGYIGMGPMASPAAYQTRLVIDGSVNKFWGVEHAEGNVNLQNALPGSNPIKLAGLAVGNHTFKLQASAVLATNLYMRAASGPDNEFMIIQVTEHMR